MDNAKQHDPVSPGNGKSRGIPLWFKLFVVVLIALVISKIPGLQVFIQISYDGTPFLAALTDVRIYFVPLILVLLYILFAWIGRKILGREDP
ncbi:MAG: hypothetical protein JSU67_15050 [Gammaproteobacteria bacterium]|nr:MAG: hypothetical protein JSU67_15050 [Gammaproteobacteria bacterium]